jgi:hypothetical protein
VPGRSVKRMSTIFTSLPISKTSFIVLAMRKLLLVSI